QRLDRQLDAVDQLPFGDHGDRARAHDAPTWASRCFVVECTESVSNAGITSRPKVSIDSTATSSGSVLLRMPKISWSAPAARHRSTERATSSGVPTLRRPASIDSTSSSTLGSGTLKVARSMSTGNGIESSQRTTSDWY